MNNSRVSKLFTILLLSVIAITSCGDDPASVNEEPPEIPQFEAIEPDLSYFDQNPAKVVNNENYQMAQYVAQLLSGSGALTQAYTGYFFSADQQTDADFENGQWVWDYNYTIEGQSASLRLTYEESGGTAYWEMFFSFDDGQGNSVENYKMVEGEISLNGNSGSWTFYVLETDNTTENLALVTTWNQTDENNVEIEMDFYSEGQITSSYTYTQVENEFDIGFVSDNESSDIFIHWNTSAQTGYYQEGTDTANRKCWDANLENTACSNVGY